MERKALEQKLTGFFEELHMHPELSYEEYETTERIKRELAAAGIEILQIPLKTGVTAIVRGAKPGKTYGLRCDIDALPIEEETDLPYKSKTPGENGMPADMIFIRRRCLEQHCCYRRERGVTGNCKNSVPAGRGIFPWCGDSS